MELFAFRVGCTCFASADVEWFARAGTIVISVTVQWLGEGSACDLLDLGACRLHTHMIRTATLRLIGICILVQWLGSV